MPPEKASAGRRLAEKLFAGREIRLENLWRAGNATGKGVCGGGRLAEKLFAGREIRLENLWWAGNAAGKGVCGAAAG